MVDLPSLKEIDFGQYGLSCSRFKGQTSLVMRSNGILLCSLLIYLNLSACHPLVIHSIAYVCYLLKVVPLINE